MPLVVSANSAGSGALYSDGLISAYFGVSGSFAYTLPSTATIGTSALNPLRTTLTLPSNAGWWVSVPSAPSTASPLVGLESVDRVRCTLDASSKLVLALASAASAEGPSVAGAGSEPPQPDSGSASARRAPATATERVRSAVMGQACHGGDGPRAGDDGLAPGGPGTVTPTRRLGQVDRRAARRGSE